MEGPPAGVPDDELDRLYGLPQDEFVRARDVLARSLRGAGERDAAAWVRGLEKPSVAAGAVNRAVREESGGLQGLLQAGRALRDAHARLLAGEGADAGVREALAAERAAVEELVDVARRERPRIGDATLDRVRETLHAVALDDETRGLVSGGRLSRERRAAGLGLVGASAATVGGRGGGAAKRGAPEKGTGGAKRTAPAKRSARAPGGRGSAKPTAPAKRTARAKPAAPAPPPPPRVDLTAVRRELREAKARERAARRELTGAERATASAQRALDRLRERAELAEADLASAQADERTAREQAGEARDEVRDAERRLGPGDAAD